LHRGNIGVALGEKSGGLCAVDFDHEDLAKDFLAVNPHLKHTLQTHGARGRVFWIRFKGPYPQRTSYLETHSGEHVGEFRSNGSQSIVWGIHPDTQKPYIFTMPRPALVVEFSSIAWPTKIATIPLCTEETEETEEPEETEDTEDTEVMRGWVFGVQTVEDALRVSVPSRVHENNALLFTLARAVKALEEQGDKFSPSKLKDVFDRWHARAMKFLRPELTKEDYLMEFLKAYQKAKYPLGSIIIPKAWERAQAEPLPQEALQFEDKKRQLLVALCRQMQILAGDAPFYLSARTVQRLFEQKTHSTAATWLHALCALNIIKPVIPPTAKRATRYRYLYPTK